MTLNQECASEQKADAVEKRMPEVNTDTVMESIRSYAAAAISETAHFTTLDIARYMGVSEYPVRAAFTWLARYRLIESVPGVRSKRYLGQPEDPTKRRHTDSYFASVYRIRETGEVDFNALMGVFCRG